MTMTYIYDLVVVLVFFTFLIISYRRGLLLTLVKFATSLIAIVLAYLFVSPFTDWLFDLGFLRQTTSSISGNVGERVLSLGNQVMISLTDFMPERWARGIIMQTEPVQDSLAAQAGNATARLFLGAVAFLILFFLVRLVIGFAARTVNRIIDHVPLIGWVNRMGGLLLGGIFAIVIISLATMVLTALAVNYETLHSVLSSSLILEFFSDKDIFMSLLDTII